MLSLASLIFNYNKWYDPQPSWSAWNAWLFQVISDLIPLPETNNLSFVYQTPYKTSSDQMKLVILNT